MTALPRVATSACISISIEDFEEGAIDPGQFDHEAHVHLAWSYLQKYNQRSAASPDQEARHSIEVSRDDHLVFPDLDR